MWWSDGLFLLTHIIKNSIFYNKLLLKCMIDVLSVVSSMWTLMDWIYPCFFCKGLHKNVPMLEDISIMILNAKNMGTNNSVAWCHRQLKYCKQIRQMKRISEVPRIWKTQPWVFCWLYWKNSSRNQAWTLGFFLYKFVLTSKAKEKIVSLSHYSDTGVVTPEWGRKNCTGKVELPWTLHWWILN